jgi:preprotein translocase subunit SecF
VFEIVPPGTKIDFIGKWRVCMIASALLILAGVLAIPVRGFRLGVDFAGGTEVQVRFEGEAPVGEGPIRSAIEGLGIEEPSVVRYGPEGTREFLIRFRGEIDANDENRTERLEQALETAIGPLDVQRVEYVGPKVGAELRRAGILSLALAFALILVYVGFRFSPRFAPGAVVALVHDVLTTCAIWILLGLEFDLQVVAALLTIIGYSINDTIVIYDRIRETMELHTKVDLADVINRSVNQTLSRTILTTGATLLAVAALLTVPAVRPFALAMVFGMISGVYSTVYIASAILLLLEKRGAAGRATGTSSGGGAARRSAGKAKAARP